MNIGSIADRAFFRISEVPTAISGTVMQNYAEESIRFVNNYAQQSLGTTGIGERWQNILINLTEAYTRARMDDAGADFNWTLGEFSVNKNGVSSSHSKRAEQLFNNAVSELKSIGGRAILSKANG